MKMFQVFLLLTLVVILRAQEDCVINGVSIPSGSVHDLDACTQCFCDESGGPACVKLPCDNECPDGSLPQPMEGQCCPVCPDVSEIAEPFDA